MLSNLPAYLANAKKAIINVTGLLASLLALGLLPEKYAAFAASALAVLTAITHYFTANAPAPGEQPAQEEFAPEDSQVLPEFQPAAVVTASQVAASNQAAAPTQVIATPPTQ